ncbi:sensor domain-containing diguanylate cyclase [Desulfovibrio inopinatus]|uniref:sensor domain-containing diguanylate cyclase n=1 Tax=Desulfovibrio inopinatus TaxID=102109 RepID=UPI00040B30EF|nr:diguanylate cyclase [Desulfovibrio inopinatus]
MASQTASPRTSLPPPFAPVVMRLMTMAVSPAPDVDEMADILGLDPVLTSTILSLANSAFFGSRSKVVDIKRAVMTMGIDQVIKIALFSALKTNSTVSENTDTESYFQLWRRMVWSATAAQRLAHQLCPDQEHAVYITTLLKDIDELARLVCVDGNEAQRFACKQTLAEHARHSAELLAGWEIPLPEPGAVQNHHDFSGILNYTPFTQAVILATRWAELEVGGNANPVAVVEFNTTFKNMLGLEKEELNSLRNECTEIYKAYLATLDIAESVPEERYYNHSLRRMEEFYILSMQLANAGGGLTSIASMLAKHLKWRFNIESFDLSLKIPRSRQWTFFQAQAERGVQSKDVTAVEVHRFWRSTETGHIIMASGEQVGEFRLIDPNVSQEARDELTLYLMFVNQAYEQYMMRQAVLEQKASALDSLPVGIALLNSEGRIMETNERLRSLLDIKEDVTGRDIWPLISNLKGFSVDFAWNTFLRDNTHLSIKKIFCKRSTPESEGTCYYLFARKRGTPGHGEVILQLEDVTDITYFEMRNIRQREFLERLIANMRDIVFTIDSTGTITFASPRFAPLVIGKNLFKLTSAAASMPQGWNPDYLTLSSAPVEVELPITKDRTLKLELIITPLPSPTGAAGEFLVVGRDITTVRRLEDKLKRQAITDGLTGLFNYHHFQTILDREIYRARRTGRRMGLVFFDLDGFKQINDTLGHQVGDKTLIKVSEIMKTKIRQGMDFPCRYGGDEFAIIATEIEPEQLQAMALRLQTAIKEHFGGKLTTSTGLASLLPGELGKDLFNRVDKASYEAKSRGGGLIVWAKNTE